MGYTEDELLQPMREHAKKYEIDEPEKGVFCKDGEHALCEISMFVPEIIDEDPQYMNFLDVWTLDVDGEKENCIEETYKWLRKHQSKAVLG